MPVKQKSTKPGEDCVYCNLMDLFVSYGFDESKVITPEKVRESLCTMGDVNFTKGYAKGEMACALETFEEILSFMHRENIDLNYHEGMSDLDEIQKLEIKLDQTGCSLKCIAHKTFGLEIGELLQCPSCKTVEEVQNIALSYVFNMYSYELVKIKQDAFMNGQELSFEQIIKRIHKEEVGARKLKTKSCTACKTRPNLVMDDNILLSTPDVFGISIQWPDTEEVDKDSIETVFNLLQPHIDVR